MVTMTCAIIFDCITSKDYIIFILPSGKANLILKEFFLKTVILFRPILNHFNAGISKSISLFVCYNIVK